MVKPLHVLYLFDSKLDADLVEQTLITANFHVVSQTATTREQLLEALSLRLWDVIISDYQLKNLDSRVALSAINDRKMNTLFILTADEISEENAVDVMNRGAFIILKKALRGLGPLIERELKDLRNFARLKELEERMRQAPKLEALGRLAGGVAHDFNNILATITICGEQALSEMTPSSSTHNHVSLVLKASERGAALTKQLLAFTRNQVSEPQIVNVNSIISNMEKLLKRLIGTDIELITDLTPSISNMKIDPIQVEQIIMNLMVNARDAMPDGGTITFRSANVDLLAQSSDLFDVQDGSYVMFSVTDTGCGMDAQTQSKIFEPFFSTKGERGTGLGLSTVFGIVRQNRGYITVQSVPGSGSTFKVYLPVSQQAIGLLNSNQALHNMSFQSMDLSILLVEDEPWLRDAMAENLKRMGYNVMAAENCEKAIELAKDQSHTIDVLFTDLIMPKMKGTVLAKEILQYRPNVKILFMSGYTDLSHSDFSTIKVRSEFLQKPFTTASLEKKLQELIAAPTLLKAAEQKSRGVDSNTGTE